MEYINKQALDEAIKEFIRVMVSGVAPIYTTTISILILGINQETGTFGISWMKVLAAFTIATLGLLGTAITRATDRYIHVNPEIKSDGFLPK